MPTEMAKATATAEYEGNMDVVTGNISKFMAERDKQKESEIRAQYLAQMPTPQSGNVGQVDYSAQIKQAMDTGDMQSAVLAILNQSAACSAFASASCSSAVCLALSCFLRLPSDVHNLSLSDFNLALLAFSCASCAIRLSTVSSLPLLLSSGLVV